jgi:hypothetical protein
MVLSELKLLGNYFAYKIDTDYVISEDIIGEYEKKKYLLKKKDEIE